MVYLPESSMETPLIVRQANLPWSSETTYWKSEMKGYKKVWGGGGAAQQLKHSLTFKKKEKKRSVT